MNRRAPLCSALLALTALLLCGGCATFREAAEEGARDQRARAHGGSGFKPTYGAGGVYTGYTQQVGRYVYQHAPDGTIIGKRPELPPVHWVSHHDEQGRLVRKTLDGEWLQAEMIYHYDAEGELESITNRSRKPGEQWHSVTRRQPEVFGTGSGW